MISVRQHVIMIASENDALIGAKIGGVGDVVRSLPNALTRHGWRVTVIIPSYGFLHKNNPSKVVARVSFPFGGRQEEGVMFSAEAKEPHEGVTHLLFDHDGIRGDPVYVNDPPDSPFAQDAAKYALFCSAVGQFLKTFDQKFVLHLHDWHCGTLFLLRELHGEFSFLKNIHTVFTIHNLAIQGTRPMRGNLSSVEQWFPELFRTAKWVDNWKDRRYTEPTFTPMEAGIRCAAKVNTVSPTYAEEILTPNDVQNGYHGGEGLEDILRRAHNEHRLTGILNGCEYPEHRAIPKMPFSDLFDLMLKEIESVNVKNQKGTVETFRRRLQRFTSCPPSVTFTSITRVVEQKMRLLFEECSNGVAAIDEIMKMLDDLDGIYVILGSGTEDYEQLLEQAGSRSERLLFVKGYSEKLSQALYANGSLFVMPSLFEPCGISQMLAMRDGQPCLVHAVGGLRDTVMGGVNGFMFYGTNFWEKADSLVATAKDAAERIIHNKPLLEKIRIEAAKARFTWDQSANKYIELLYS